MTKQANAKADVKVWKELYQDAIKNLEKIVKLQKHKVKIYNNSGKDITDKKIAELDKVIKNLKKQFELAKKRTIKIKLEKP